MNIDRDVWSGAFFMLVGALGLYFGADYAFGTTARMGPGFLPKLLCWCLVALGAIIFLTGLVRRGDPMDRWSFRPLLLILASVLVFGGLIESAGLLAATMGMTLVGALGSSETRWLETIAVGAGLGIGSVLIFVYGLGLTMKILPWTV